MSCNINITAFNINITPCNNNITPRISLLHTVIKILHPGKIILHPVILILHTVILILHPVILMLHPAIIILHPVSLSWFASMSLINRKPHSIGKITPHQIEGGGRGRCLSLWSLGLRCHAENNFKDGFLGKLSGWEGVGD